MNTFPNGNPSFNANSDSMNNPMSNTTALHSSLAASIAAGATKIDDSVEGLRLSLTENVGNAVSKAEDLAQRGMDRARGIASQARHRAADMQHAAADRVQADPMKALLIAAAAGAATALLVRWLSSTRRGE